MIEMTTQAATPIQQQQQRINSLSNPSTIPNAINASPSATDNASLYVGELEPSVTEATLFDLFSSIGSVISIRVCRDAVTRRSLGYAYVNFQNMADGERAVSELNYHVLKNQPIRIMWSQRDPSMRRTGTGNIFIKNLDLEIDNKALHDTFCVFGHILSCKINCDENNVSKGYGFIHYAEADAADAAIQSVNGMLINDKKVFVGHHVTKKERESKQEETRQKFTNVFVKNLPETFTDEEFTQMFSKFGLTTSAVLSKNEDGVSKGFGFINFGSSEEAHAAVSALNDTDFQGKQLYVGRAQKKTERLDDLKKQYEKQKEEKISAFQGVNLYVKNLDEAVTEDMIRQEFASCGAIVSCRIMKDEKTEQSKGFGFVCFTSQDEAQKACNEMNGRMMLGKPIYVAVAQRKESRHQMLTNQMQQRIQQRQNQMVGFPGQPMFYQNQQVPRVVNSLQQQQGFFQPQHGMQQQQRGPRYQGQQQQMQYQGQQILPGMAPPSQQQQQQQQMGGYQGQAQQQQMPRQQQMSRQHHQQRPQYPHQQGGVPMQQQAYNMQQQQQNQANRGGKGGYKYAPNVRNVPASKKLDPTQLAALPVEEQKRVLGEYLFPLVTNVTQTMDLVDITGKITGMMLDMDMSELIAMMENEASLEESVKEAINALRE